MKLPPETWHNRYLEQARWTQPARRFLFDKVGLSHKKNILEVGCGTGAVLQEISSKPGLTLFGLDISSESLAFARQKNPGVLFEQGNACCLPFGSANFDIVYTHYLLLWLDDPSRALAEIRRVTKRDGFVLALAEPDYGGRIDHPSELSTLGKWQVASLEHQGADPFMGRKLGELFLKAGLVEVQSGVLGGEWRHPPTTRLDQTEWDVILHDLKVLPDSPPHWEIQHFKELETQAQKTGSRVLFVPTFYAMGKVPG